MKFNHEAPRDFAPQTLRALAKAATQFEERAREGNRIADSVRAAVYETREAEGFSMRMLASLCCQRLRVVVVLETVSVLMQAVVVFVLGVVLEELELGGTLPWLGEDYAVVAVPFALFLIGRCVEQLARHRRRRLSEQVALALRSRLFHRALVCGGPLPLAAASRVVAALTKRCRLRLVAPVLGSALSVALLVAATSVAATAGASLVVLATAVEVILKRRVPKWVQAAGKLRCRREELSCAFLSDLQCASATVKCFGWEAAVFQRLGRLRVEEQRLQERASRSHATLLAVRTAATIWACLASLALHWLVVRPPTLWECFQALAACRLLAQQLQQVLRILLTAGPTAAAVFGGSVKSPRPVPKQGTPASYKTSRFAVAVEGMRFFWPNLEGSKEASSLPSPPKPAGLTASAKAQKAVNGLSLVDSVSDDASVAERAKRSTHGSAGFDVKVLSLQVKRGSHIALVGAAGSGKSTLLAGLVGGCQAELWGEDLEETGILLSGRCAYAPQKPAVLSGSSIRDNVVFGSTWDAHRYEQVLVMSTLSEDLPALEFGDSSFPEALSAAALGALQLARALYVEAEILLLDEPFASMELERAKRVLSNLVRKAKDRTVVLATQTLSVLGPMDSIVVLRNGTVFEQGDYKTLASMPTEFSRLLLIAKEKEKRSRESRNGFACPCMCYEVAPDPLRELYPFDEEFGTFPTFGFGSVLEAGPRKWVSQQPLAEPVVAHLTPAIPAPTAASPSEAAGAQLPPSASAVPAVGASEAGGFLTRAAESPAEVPELPEEEGIPRPNTSAAAREVPGPIVPPRPEDPDFSHGASSPSADGLRRRSAAALDSEAPLTSPVLRTDAIHSAPLPQRLGKPEDEGKDIKAKRRRPEREDKEPKHSGSQRAAHARDAVEEKQGFLSSSSSSFGHYHQEAAPSLPKGRGNGVLLLLGHSGHASAMMAAVLAIGMLANLSVPILLSYVVAEVPTAVPSNTSTGTTRSPADMTTSATTEVSVRTSPRPVIPPFQPGTTDDSEVVWRGFSTTSSTEASPPSATSTTSTTELSMSSRAPSQEWSLWSTGHFCAEPDLAQETRPEGSYDLDATVGWHWSTKLSLADCKLACEELADWACRFISWGGPASTERWCYVHRHCSSMMRVPMYQIMEVNFTASPMRLRRRLTAPASTASIARGRVQGSARHGRQLLKVQIVDGGTTAWISQNSARVLLAALSSLLPLMGLWQARAACLVAIQASHKGSQLQLRALLAEAGQGIIIAGSLKEDLQQPTGTSRRQSEHSLLQDIADADHFLPLALPRCILALCQVLAALLCTAAACSRQAVPAVMLTILVASAMYFHHRRLSLVQQLRRFANRSEAAAALQMLHLTECHEALCLHGHGDALWKNYEACCKDAALAGLASDAAERWLYSCLHVLVALLLGLLSFSAMTQAQSLPSDFGFAVAVASVVQVAMVPDALVEFVKHGAQLTHGLAALRRMAQTCKEAAFEELESPIATLEIESRGFKPAAAALVSRSGKVALGDVLIENENLAEIAEPQVPSQSQSISHAGFPMEKVPGDWPYFGAIEFEKVTVRYGPGLSPALSSCSLVLPAGKALLVTGAKGCGKSSLLKAVLRCCYIESGRVVLDAVDVRCVSLATLRGRVAVVPQELCIFNGSWRQNLDPMGEFDEDELKRVLRLTRLENFLLRTASDLDATIAPEVLEPGPAAASAVLLCLCRALLRLLQGRSKLLMMDAATCRFNPASDADLTAIILRYCRRRGAAMLQVSQRAQQAPLYDEVAVMATGRVVEQGPAKKLWVKDGALRRVAKDQGLDSSKMTKPDVLAARLMPVWGWEVSPQEDPAFSDEFAVSMKKAKG